MPKRKRKKEDGSKNKVKYKGVYKIGKRFTAAIRIDGKLQSLGMFDTPKEAAIAFDLAAIQAGRQTSKLNFLDQVASWNTTGFTGVSKKHGRFSARIRIGGKLQTIGTFGTAKEAAIAWDLAAIQAKRSTSYI